MKSTDIVLQEGLRALGISLSQEQQQRLLVYLSLLEKWNKAFNLTSVTDPIEMVTHHLLDSLSILKYVHGQRILDVGSGAGLPGIPLACALPDKQFVLIDSNGKKVRFMVQAVAELKLSNVSVVHTRAEAFQPKMCFNTVTARALSSLSEIVDMTRHLLCEDGMILAMKGVYPEDELKTLQKPAEVVKLNVPGLKDRHVVIIGVK